MHTRRKIMKSFILEAHRGVGTEFPEETMSAFQAAVEQGYGMIELDTKFTKDNRCILLHDRIINRTARSTTGKVFDKIKPVAELTLAELLEMDFGLWKAPEFTGEKIPTLEQVLEFALKKNVPLKFDNVLWSHTKEQQEVFFRTIRDMNAESITEITCASHEAIQTVRKQLPSCRIHYDGPVTEEAMMVVGSLVPKDLLTTWLRFDNKITAWCKNPPVSNTNAAFVKKFGRLGVWLLTEKEELELAVNCYGADIIETDGSLKPF